MEPKQPTENTEIVALKAQVAALEQQVKSSQEILKWGMGMFITFAVVFAGFNWWTGKSNYDRDKDSMKTQGELLERKLAMNQKETDTARDKQFADFKAEILRLDLDRNFQYQSTVTNLAGIISKLFNEQAGKISVQQSNLQAQLDAQVTLTKQTLEQALTSQAQTLSNSISQSVVRDEGLALMAMGEAYYQVCHFETGEKLDENFGNAIPLLIEGGKQLAMAGDASTYLPQCIFTVSHFTDYVTKYNKKSKAILERGYTLQKMDEFIKALEANQGGWSHYAIIVKGNRKTLADCMAKEK